MQVLGFDPSLTQFGWAIHDTDVEGKGRCIDRGRFSTGPRDLFVDRYIYMRESVRRLIKRTGLRRVGVESPVFNDLWSEGMYGLFLYVNEALRLERADVVFLSPGQIKAHARVVLGRPTKPTLWKMEKQDMVEAAQVDASDRRAWNHNEADAYWVARTAGRFWKLHDGDIHKGDLTPLERKQFTEIHTFQKGKKAGKTVKKGILHREDDRFFLWSQEKIEDPSWGGSPLGLAPEEG